MVRSLAWLLVGIAIPVLVMAGLSVVSRFVTPRLGMKEQRMVPCPRSPNCVSSEEIRPGDPPPFVIAGEPAAAWRDLKKAVIALQGEIVREEADYLHAVFATPVFRFIDDLELRMDHELGVVHYRSASRIGYSDLGMNRRRIERLKDVYERSTVRSG